MVSYINLMIKTWLISKDEGVKYDYGEGFGHVGKSTSGARG